MSGARGDGGAVGDFGRRLLDPTPEIPCRNTQALQSQQSCGEEWGVFAG